MHDRPVNRYVKPFETAEYKQTKLISNEQVACGCRIVDVYVCKYRYEMKKKHNTRI